MKAAMLLAILAITGASSEGTSQPREEHGGRVPYGPKRAPPPVTRTGWIELATPTPTRHGTEWIFVDENVGPLRVFRIEATAGTVHLRSVRIELAGGKVVRLSTDRWLDRRRPSTRIDLGALQHVDRIAITTSRAPEGSYVLYGAAVAPRDDLVASASSGATPASM